MMKKRLIATLQNLAIGLGVVTLLALVVMGGMAELGWRW